MKQTQNILLLYCFFFLISFSEEDIITNPIKTDKDSNPVDCRIIYKSITAEITSSSLTLNILNNFVKFPHNAYLLSQPTFVFLNEGGFNNMFLGDRYFKFDFYEDEIKANSIINPGNLPSDISNIKFTDYIMHIEYRGTTKQKDNMCKIDSNENIFYRKDGQNLYFYYKYMGKSFSVNFGDIDEQVSCKVIKEALYVCAFSQNSQIQLKFLVLIYYENLNAEARELKVIDTISVFKLNNHDNAILYNTSDSNYKILCGRNVQYNDIKCCAIEFNFEYTPGMSSFTTTPFTAYDIATGYETSFLYNEDYCNSVKFNSEFLVCCKKDNNIVCDRRDENQFLLINRFNLEFPFQISNVSLEKGEDNLN